METNQKKLVTTRPFVDTKYLVETSYQFDIKKSYRDYTMRNDDGSNADPPIAHSKNRNMVVPSKTSSEVAEIPMVVQETRSEIKKRRRQELQDNYDTEPYDPVVDELLDNQIKHYCVLQQRGLVSVQVKAKFSQQKREREGIEDGEESDPAAKYQGYYPSVSISQLLAQSKSPIPCHGENNISTIGQVIADRLLKCRKRRTR